MAIPHGVYDLARNCGHITLGNSHDTCAFAIDSLLLWWKLDGRRAYGAATELLLLCDGGGSKPSRSLLFKSELQRFVDQTGLRVRVAHYPPYKSKYNPIEHRLSPHLDRTYRGVILRSLDTLRDLIQTTSTARGLEVTVTVLKKAYQKGLKISDAVKDSLHYIADRFLADWNYRVLPSGS